MPGHPLPAVHVIGPAGTLLDRAAPAGPAVRRRQLLQGGLGALAGGVASLLVPGRVRAASAGSGAAGLEAGGLRSALVIGNAAYLRAPLRNPVADAQLVAQSLRSIGFEVEAQENLALAALRTTLGRWLQRTVAAEVRLLYFAGHGAQYRGQNFLLPVDALPREEADLLHTSINASEVIERLARLSRGVNVVVLDACRGSLPPLEPPASRAATRGLLGDDAAAPGLAATVSPQGTFIAYAAAPGAAALDGSGTHGYYARHLAREMLVDGAPIESVFKRVRASVARDTANRQMPWETSSLVGDFCLRRSSSCGREAGGTIDLGRLR